MRSFKTATSPVTCSAKWARTAVIALVRAASAVARDTTVVVRLATLLGMVTTLLGQASICFGQDNLIKLGTLAPEGSNWMSVLRAMDAEIRRETDGSVGFKIYPGGVQGDEKTMLRKIRVGQLHGGAFGGQGATQIFPDLLALEMPFLFDNYEEIDYVLEKLTPFYEQGYAERGYVLLGWADIGFVYILAKQPIAAKRDIQGLKVWRLEGEPITEVLFRKAGVSSVPLIIPDVLLGLQTNLVEVVYAPPVVAIVMQWFTRVDYLTELPVNYTLGALLVSKRAFDRLSVSDQTKLRDISGKHMRNQMSRNRLDNEEALRVIQERGVQLITPAAEEVRGFHELVRNSVPELVGSALSQNSYDLVLQYLREYRQSQAPADAP